MKPERWQQIDQVLEAALERKSNEWAAFLDQECGSDEELRREVESLLRAHEQAGSFIEKLPPEAAEEILQEHQSESLIGKQVGAYRIEALLGRGGMGEVYLATDKMGRQVALKLLAHHHHHDKRHVARFAQEAQTVLTLNHPNIVTIYDIGEIDRTSYIASELIEGETLRGCLEQAEIHLQDILDIAIQVANALVAAHEKGIVHRDIKPENVMIRGDGYVKVLDFGIAKLTEDFASAVSEDATTRLKIETGEGVVIGTAFYMSPEQAKGAKVDARTDLWSLGAVLYEMITRQVPFAGETPTETISLILQREPAPLTRWTPEVPAELERIVSKALTKNRDERYQTARDLLIDLRNLKRKLEVDAEIDRTALPEFRTLGSAGSGQGEPATATGSLVTTVSAARASSAEYIVSGIKQHKLAAAIAVFVIVASAVALSFYLHGRNTESAIESIAVLPFQNRSTETDTEYLSDGLTESLIYRLSQLPNLKVSPTSSVFHYKGKEMDAIKVGQELGVSAVLSGRIVQRGDNLTISAELVDVRYNKLLWGEQYERKMSELLQTQREIARDVSQKLRMRLSGADEQKLAKNYTANTEAYQLYLKGRYHLLKLTPPEIQTGISYFNQAIEIDPSYALAYVGLADAYRLPTLIGEMPGTEVLPKAKAAAQKAIEIDDTLAEGHASLGFIIFWYDWDWNAAENQYKRALELDPNSADTHIFYAHLLSNTGRHAEALAEAKRARELDPLNLRINAMEGLFLLHARLTDEAIARLQKTFELDANYYIAHMFASSAYIEKGMYAEAIAEARNARGLSGVSSYPTAFLGYALAKSGKQAEARSVLEELLKLSTERYVSPYNIALIYNGLDERDKTLDWLGKGYQQRDPRMVFLKVEPKWNNLRDDPRFKDLLRRVGF